MTARVYKIVSNYELTCDTCGEVEGDGRKQIVCETKCNYKKCIKCISVEATCTLCIGR